MYYQQLKKILAAKHLSRADLASAAGVSRAAATKWFQQGEKTGFVNMETATLIRLAAGLGVEPDFFFKKKQDDLSAIKIRFLWDALYPQMEDFALALAEQRLPALARLVQVLGFRKAQAMMGKAVIDLFPKYQKYLKPARRKHLEILWPLYASHS